MASAALKIFDSSSLIIDYAKLRPGKEKFIKKISLPMITEQVPFENNLLRQARQNSNIQSQTPLQHKAFPELNSG